MDLNMGAIIGTTHIKTKSSFSPSIGKKCTANSICSSDDAVTYVIHILHFLRYAVSFKNSEKKNPNELNMEKERSGNGSPVFIQRSGISVSTKARTKIIPMGTRCKAVFSITTRKLLPVTLGSSNGMEPVTLNSIKVHHTVTFGEAHSCPVTS